MAHKPHPADNVMSLFEEPDVAEEFAVDHMLIPKAPPAADVGTVLDLSGKTKVMLAFEAGATGKTTWLRCPWQGGQRVTSRYYRITLRSDLRPARRCRNGRWGNKVSMLRCKVSGGSAAEQDKS